MKYPYEDPRLPRWAELGEAKKAKIWQDTSDGTLSWAELTEEQRNTMASLQDLLERSEAAKAQEQRNREAAKAQEQSNAVGESIEGAIRLIGRILLYALLILFGLFIIWLASQTAI